MIFVTQAQYVDSYRVRIVFSDRREGIVDLRDTICNDHRAIFRELEDMEKFKRLRVELDTVVWDNGLDLAPEYLYDKLRDTKTNGDFFEKMNS